MEGKAGGALRVFAGCRPDLLGLPYRASPLDGGGCEALRGLRAAARTCLPYRASLLGGWVREALWGLRAAARTCLPCRASLLGGGAVRPYGFCGLPPGPAGFALPGESVGRWGA